MAVAIVVVLAVLFGGAASAHSDLESTSPADGSTVTEPVGEIEIVFSSGVDEVGAGFEVLDPQGEIRAPEVEAVDERTFVLRLDPALAGGSVGVRYAVTAEDGHAIAGGFTFEVDAPLPTTIPATTAPATTAPATTNPATTAPATAPGTTVAPATAVTSTVSPASTTPTPTTAPGTETTSTDASESNASATTPGGTDPDRIESGVVGALGLAIVGGVGGGWALRRKGERSA